MLRGPEHDLRSPVTIAEWYRRFLTDPAVQQDTRHVQLARSQLRYKTTAERFRMIDDDTISVAVPWPPDDPRAPAIQRVLSQLRDQSPVGPSEARKLQDVTLSLRRRLADQALRDKLAERVTDHLLEWAADAYDEQTGLVLTPVPRGEEIL